MTTPRGGRRQFSLEEANALLPLLEPLVRDVQMRVAALRQMQMNIERTAQLKSRGNGHRVDEEAELAKLRQEADDMEQSIQAIVREIHGYGCELKDPLMGLLDFRTQRGDKEVYLCWRLGEQSITFWHDLDTGFAGRQPLQGED